MTDQIYLDHAATTPIRAEVRAAMEPWLWENYANASSVYRMAQSARSALDRARDSVAACFGATPAEIVFTSGGTESDNAAIKGAAFARRDDGRHLVTTTIEHHAVLHPFEELRERFGFEVTVVPVESNGIVNVDTLTASLRPDSTLVSVMWANNEIGTIQPIEQIAALTRERGITLHVDAVQAAGAVSIDLQNVPVDLLSISAHKFYGPKGVGALYVRRGTPWWPLLTGGGQERNRRAGTENVAGIVGLSCAQAIACQERDSGNARLAALRDRLLHAIERGISGVTLNGDRVKRLPNNLNVCFEGVHGESLLVGLDLDGVSSSSGSACTSGSLEPSHVLLAIGVPARLAQSSLRLTLGRDNTERDVDRTVDLLHRLVSRLRAQSPAPKAVR